MHPPSDIKVDSMIKPYFSRTFVFALVSIVSVFGRGDLTARGFADERPNLLLILVDDLGYSDLGCFGGEIGTPNIDRLAANGLRFTQCYNSARCCPSRASLMSGLYPHQAGIGSFAQSQPSREKGPAYLGHLNDQCVTLAEVLKSAGYHNYMVGKWHMEEPGPIARGFDEFYGFVKGYEQDQWKLDRYTRLPEGRTPELNFDDGSFYATDAFSDYAVEFLKQAAAQEDQPWFLYLAHSAPHFPVQAPAKSVQRNVAKYRRGWDQLREERYERMQEVGLAGESWTLTERSWVPVDRDDIANGYPGQRNPAWSDLTPERQEDLAYRMATFAAMVQHVDHGIQRIVAQLESMGQLDNTVIMLLSDNGACYEWGPFGFDGPSRQGVTKLHTGHELAEMGGPGTYHAYGSGWANLCNTPFQMYKHFTHEGGVCTPLIVHWPQGIDETDRWVRDPVHLIDIMPTFCELANANYPTERNDQAIQPMEGTSLVPTFHGAMLSERSIMFEHQEARAVRRGQWKIVWSKRMPFEIKWELYNLASDRCETSDLAEVYPELTNELAKEWEAWARRVKVFPFYKSNNGDASNGIASPQIADRPLQVRCKVMLSDGTNEGVILAHGGNQHGYSLHVEKRKLVFSVRRNGEVSAIRADCPIGEEFDVVAQLTGEGTMKLSINEKLKSIKEGVGLIEVQPLDRLSLGFDDRSAVGNYESPYKFEGKYRAVEVNTGRE